MAPQFLSSGVMSESLLPLPSNGKEKGAKEGRLCSVKTVALCLSLLLNLASWRASSSPHWSADAVQAAELAASRWCSGHGSVFVDSVDVSGDGSPLCECHDCFSGPDCSLAVPGCIVDADRLAPELPVDYGTPFPRRYTILACDLLFGNPDMGTLVVPGWYRMSYKTRDGATTFSTDGLIAAIRALHAKVGNAVTEGRYILLGTGSMQLINAAVASLALDNTTISSHVVATAPYYGAYKTQTEFLASPNYQWVGEPDRTSSNPKGEAQIELIASPNNPTAQIQEVPGHVNGPVVYDHAYYWPHLTPITKPVDHDIMFFTLSKVTGHAGSRIGWAIVKDLDLYTKMTWYVTLNTLGVSHDAQLRGTQLIRAILKGYSAAATSDEQKIFHYGHKVLASRWVRLQDIFRNSSRFTLQELEPDHCSFFGHQSAPSPGYAWVRCEQEEDVDCKAVMLAAGIIGREGSVFGAEDRYVRLSLLKRQSTFDNLAAHLSALVAKS